MKKRIYIHKIIVFRMVGNEPQQVGQFRAKNVSIGRAGDKLWFVDKLKKFLPPATIQSAAFEYWFWIREDGEWFNFGLENLDKSLKRAGAKFIHQDMRMQRLATDRLLEQRLLQKSFLEKWGTAIGLVIFFVIIAVSLTIYLYMFSKVVDKVGVLLDKANLIVKSSGASSPETGQLIPTSLLFVTLPVECIRRKLIQWFG